ncbi:MFS transporter [Tsukamurella spumae]|uniref:MFS transporter n=1 Tax=Tsukamurella spumae TaxID=44753 RepID=A0A846X6I6_9ACTN|nr:MFS transporter [Tsukamurella spumae]NKY20106.1 MFS transporter [Tsukamurella spumae]
MLRPLLRRNYRFLFVTLLCALIADGMWMIAMVWQVIRMGGSPTSVSVVSGGAAAGLLVSTLAGGVLADRLPQQRILFVLEIVNAITIGSVGVLVLTDAVTVPMMLLATFALGLVSGFYFPAYSALVPRLVSPGELLAVNGYESAVRPAASMAAGPAIAGALIAVHSPGLALVVAGCLPVLGALFVSRIRLEPDGAVDDGSDGREPGHPLRELWEGVQYVRRTPWLLATLLFASLLVLLVSGPLDVLLPFAIKDHAGGGPSDHSMILAAYGFGGVAGALLMASRKLPRRYLTVMMCLWGVGALPLAVYGTATNILVMVVAGFVLGVVFEAPVVIWGTLLQRRVPRRLLGRVSSLDFFVSLVFMPLSLALAGPVSHAIGLTATFVLAAVLPIPLAAIAILAARMPRDELEHPLPDDDAPVSPTVNAPPAERTVG